MFSCVEPSPSLIHSGAEFQTGLPGPWVLVQENVDEVGGLFSKKMRSQIDADGLENWVAHSEEAKIIRATAVPEFTEWQRFPNAILIRGKSNDGREFSA